MGVLFLYASFPNSRNKPRPATTDAFTYQQTIADTTANYTRVATATGNRTYILLENFSQSTGAWYVYATTSAVNPTVTATFGNIGDMIFFTGSNTLYQKQDIGTTVNWSAVAIEDVGERIAPLQTASLESPQDIYMAADSAVPVIPAVVIGIDQGLG